MVEVAEQEQVPVMMKQHAFDMQKAIEDLIFLCIEKLFYRINKY